MIALSIVSAIASMPWSPKAKTARVPLMGVSSGSIHRASRAKIAFMVIEYTRAIERYFARKLSACVAFVPTGSATGKYV